MRHLLLALVVGAAIQVLRRRSRNRVMLDLHELAHDQIVEGLGRVYAGEHS